MRKIYAALNAVRMTIIILVFSIIVIVGATQIFLRYFTPSGLRPFSWADEIMRYLNIWLVMLAASIATKEGTHLSMDYFLRKAVPARYIVVFKKAADLIVILCLGFVFFFGLQRTIANAAAQIQSLPISISFFYAAIPAGCFFLIVDYLLILIYGEHPFAKKKETTSPS